MGTLASLSIAKPTRNVSRILHKASDLLPHTYLGTEDMLNSESQLGLTGPSDQERPSRNAAGRKRGILGRGHRRKGLGGNWDFHFTP